MSKDKVWTKWLPVILIGLVIVGVIWWSVYQLAPVPTAPAEKSTFKTSAYVDGEDVSNILPLSLWTPKSGVVFDEPADIYAITLNFQETTSSVDADDISVDLSEIPYFWYQMDPDGEILFGEHWGLLYPNGVNKLYTLNAYDPTTDVNFNIIDGNMNEVTVANHQTNGNYTIVYDCPHYTTTSAQLHIGTGWAMTTTDFADLTQTQQEEYYDEAIWAGQFSLFNPNDFTYKTTLAHPLLSSMTNGFCFKYTFNTSVSIVDGATTQVNFTVTDDSYFDLAISGECIYLIAYSPILFSSGVQQLHFEIQYASNITLSDVDSGNVPILQSGNSLGSFVKLSDIAS